MKSAATRIQKRRLGAVSSRAVARCARAVCGDAAGTPVDGEGSSIGGVACSTGAAEYAVPGPSRAELSRVTGRMQVEAVATAQSAAVRATMMRGWRNGDILRIGHKGAAALAPENTIASLAAALESGVDMVEFDVVDAPDGSLVLAHSHEEIEAGVPRHSTRRSPSWRPRRPARLQPRSSTSRAKASRRESRDALPAARPRSSARSSARFIRQSLRELATVRADLRTGISYPWIGEASRPGGP